MPILVPVFVRSYKTEVNLGHEAQILTKLGLLTHPQEYTF